MLEVRFDDPERLLKQHSFYFLQLSLEGNIRHFLSRLVSKRFLTIN
ncbi:hypothetical protein EV05_1958 [Prochlorococcus sp. MIT 0601]|nr:hypothetical protein EV05_1958 [Prochlorococcus sp. MIT 0601]